MSLLVMQPVAAKKGASSVEVYGFAGWILSAVAFALYCLWAFVPEPVLHSIGITYYPTKEWALIIPTLIIFSVLFVYWVYESLNMMSVAEPTALTTIHDARSKWITDIGIPSAAGSTHRNIPPLVHMPAPLVSQVLYGGVSFAEAEAQVYQRYNSNQATAAGQDVGS
eukprot:GHUV01006076.1.p1 GENE.GHUV01006076.1~~GHUV01006076.1.p1  ORF type:complete len:167 (+),score=48.18 GHUV01006076.1:159-659(+)